MFELSVPFWQLILRAGAVYVFVLAAIKLLGRKELGQMSAPDLVLILLVANSLQNAMIGPDVSLLGGLIAAGTLFSCNRLADFLAGRFPQAHAVLAGEPVLLVHDGQVLPEHLRRENVQVSDVKMAMREHGLDDIKHVRTAVLEADGSISIVPSEGSTLVKSAHRVKRIKRRPT